VGGRGPPLARPHVAADPPGARAPSRGGASTAAMIQASPGMEVFRLDLDAVTAARVRAAHRAGMARGAALALFATDGAALDDTDLATLLLAADVPTGTLLDLARAARPAGLRFETFAPLYLT